MLKKVAFICYDESELKNGLEKIKFNLAKYAYIKHDKDIDVDGVVKKLHFHVLLEFINGANKKQLCVDFNLKPNMFQSVSNVIGYLRYLVHKDDAEKYQYSVDDVICKGYDIKKIVESSYIMNNSDVISDLINYKNCSRYELLCYALSKDYLDVYNRFYRIIWDARVDKYFRKIE